MNVEVSRPTKVAADVGKHGKSPRRNDRATNGEAVEAIGEIHGIRGTNNHQADKDEKWKKRHGPPIRSLHQGVNHEVGVNSLGKRNHQLRRVNVTRQQHEQRTADDQTDQNLEVDFLLRREAQVLPLRDFGVVIDETDDRKSSQGKERNQDERIRQIGPKQRRNGGG